MGYTRNNIHLEAMKKHHEEKDALKQAIGRKLIYEREKKINKRMNKLERDIIIKGGRDYRNKLINYKKFAESKMNCVYGYIVVDYNERRALTCPFFFETFEKAFDYVMQETEKFLTEKDRQDVQINLKEDEDSLVGAVITDFRYTSGYNTYSRLYVDCTTYTITRVLFAPNFDGTFLIPNDIVAGGINIHEF